MFLAAEASTQVAWIGAGAVLFAAIIGGIATFLASRNREAIRGTSDVIAESTGRVINMEEVFEDMKSERNRARLLAEHERKRADAAEQRADRAQQRADGLEARIKLLEVQAEVYRLQHPGEAE